MNDCKSTSPIRGIDEVIAVLQVTKRISVDGFISLIIFGQRQCSIAPIKFSCYASSYREGSDAS